MDVPCVENASVNAHANTSDRKLDLESFVPPSGSPRPVMLAVSGGATGTAKGLGFGNIDMDVYEIACQQGQARQRSWLEDNDKVTAVFR